MKKNDGTYTLADALEDKYLSVTEAYHDARVNGWGEDIEFWDDSDDPICDAEPAPKRYGNTITAPCDQPLGHSGCHTSLDETGVRTGWHYAARH